MRDEIKREITEISAVVAAIGNNTFYKAPAGYFTDLADEILSKIQLPPTQMPFIEPEPFYFENLAATILANIKLKENAVPASEAARELRELSPLLAGIGKTNVYTVPEDYFSSLPINTAAITRPAKPIQLHKPVKWVEIYSGCSNSWHYSYRRRVIYSFPQN